MNEQQTLPIPEAEDASREVRKFDPELLAMNRIVKVLEEMSAPSRRAVVAYLWSRFNNAYDADEQF